MPVGNNAEKMFNNEKNRIFGYLHGKNCASVVARHLSHLEDFSIAAFANDFA